MSASSFINPTKPGGMQWWHIIVAGIALMLSTGIIVILTVAGVLFVQRQFQPSGGLKSAPLPPVKVAFGGPRLPVAYSLRRFLPGPRPYQGLESCVSQSAAQGLAVMWAEAHGKTKMSGEFLYDLSNGGNGPRTYDDVYGVYVSTGMATFAQFPHENDNYGYVSDAQAVIPYTGARRIASWYVIGAQDYFTQEQSIYSGRPVAIGLHVYSSMLNNGQTFFDGQSGFYEFDHVVEAIGWNSNGIQIVNSWGSAWGNDGVATLSWNFLNNYAFEDVGVNPSFALHRPPPVVDAFPLKKWNAYTTSTHTPAVSSKWHGSISEQAYWWQHAGHTAQGYKKWSPTSPEIWHPIPHGRGFEVMRFAHRGSHGHYGYYYARLFTWPGTHWTKWQKYHS